jgi:hypothetical protein
MASIILKFLAALAMLTRWFYGANLSEKENPLLDFAVFVGADDEASEAKEGLAWHRRKSGTEEKIDEGDLMPDPEIRRQIEAEVQKQIDGWVRTKVSALGGRTSLQAVADFDGGEMVEALFQGRELQDEMQGPASMARVVKGE